MHVFEVVEINEGPIDWLINNRFVNPPAEGGVARGNPGTPYEGMKFRPRRRGVEIEFPDGSRRVIRNNSRQALERAAVSWNRTNRPGFRVEPRINADDPYRRTPRTTPGADVTATRNAPTGDYDGPEIRATRNAPIGDYDGPELRADPEDRPGGRNANGDRNTPPSNTSNSTPPGFLRRIWNRLWGLVRVVIGPAGANAINAAINISAIEDSLDAYLRELRDYARGLESEADRQQFLSDMENNKAPGAIAGSYTQLVERLSELIIEGVIGMLVGGLSAAVAIKLLALAGLSTGGIGIILSLIAGGAFALLGTNGIYQILDSFNFFDWIESQLARRFFTPGALFDAAITIDGAQEFWGAAFDWIGAGDLVRDSMYNEAAEEGELQQIDSDAAERNLKRLVKSNPELMKAYQDGKEEAKKMLRKSLD